MNVAFLIGRIMIGLFFLMAGFSHFKNLSPMGQYAQAKGTPAPQLAVAGTGVMLLLGGMSVLLGAYPTVGIVLLIIIPAGSVFSDPQLLERKGCPGSAGRQNKLQEEHGAGGGVADGSHPATALA